MDLARRIPALAMGATILAAASLTGAAAVAAQSDEATYRVTIANLSPGQPLTPPVVVLHNAKTSIVEAGVSASEGIAQLAENGNPQPLLDALAADPNVGAVVAGDAPVVAGGVPGAAEMPSVAVFEISGGQEARLISFASMLICTNDGFAIVHDQKLPRQVGQAVVYSAHAYDAGSETNSEDFANMVPPCQGLVGVSSGEEGTGESDPALAENGVISPHAGIAGAADLDPEVHAVAETPALVVVERIA
jgi:hypothetical protein